MSKNYLGRCAAVGIAGLTAMSSVAIVASAASQTSMLYELRYNGIGTISMKGTIKYGNGNEYCNPVDASQDVLMDGGFVVSLTKLKALAVENGYKDLENDTLANVETSSLWENAFSDDIKSIDGDNWVYKAYGEIVSAGSTEVKLTDPYAYRFGDDGTIVFTFLNKSDRDAAKSAMISRIKSDYASLASKAQVQFKTDINAAKAKALEAAKTERDDKIAEANKTYNESEKTSDDLKTKNNAVTTANNKYNAIKKALDTSASKIISEFNATFKADNFVYDYKSGDKEKDTFAEAAAPVSYGNTVGGLSGAATATYTSAVGEDALDLTKSLYNTGSSSYNSVNDYVFSGELQMFDNITGSQLVGNGTWKNYQIIDNGATSGGNTTADGKTDKTDKTDKTTTTTSTTWYPDSSTYRGSSEVSYLGENGYWYTSASAANVYGGGYTGTSKSSNYSSVNSSADGKAIYFNSASGTYSTSSTSYSYVVKEATSSTSNSDDPYYSYFFNNGTTGNTTTTAAAAGSASIKGASKYAGWTNITSYITNKAKSGATYSINMNDETIVPSTVLAAAKAKNVTLTFINDNGSKVTVKPGKVTSDLDVSVTYSVKDIKSSLVKKAKKVNAGTVSTAQVRIGEDGSIGGTATVNVKFSTKRAGCKVKAYRLSESGSLVKTATGTINSSGRVNLNLTKGGSYLLVVIDD